jgi:hypothetical protein
MLSEWDKYIRLLALFTSSFRHENSVAKGKSERLAAYINWTFSKNIELSSLGKNTVFFTYRGF